MCASKITRGPFPFPRRTPMALPKRSRWTSVRPSSLRCSQKTSAFSRSWKVGAGIFAMAICCSSVSSPSVLRKSSDVLTQGSALSSARVCSTTGETVKLSIMGPPFCTEILTNKGKCLQIIINALYALCKQNKCPQQEDCTLLCPDGGKHHKSRGCLRRLDARAVFKTRRQAPRIAGKITPNPPGSQTCLLCAMSRQKGQSPKIGAHSAQTCGEVRHVFPFPAHHFSPFDIR